MNPRSFPGQNLVYRGPSDRIGDLPCQRLAPGQILSVWELTPEERIAIAEGADVELLIWGEPILPVSLAVSALPKVIA